MTIVTGGILPHGTGLLPGFTEKGDKREFISLRKAVKRAADIILQQKPDTIVIATPHNLRIRDHLGIVISERCDGSLSTGKKTISISVHTDLELAERIYEESFKDGLHVVSVNYGTDSGVLSSMPLDWGTIVPLYFLNDSKNIVLITPSRELPWTELVKFGRIVKSASEWLDRRVAFIASADQAHAHMKEGPYGYNNAARLYDHRVIKLVKQAELGKLISFPRSLVQKAKPDSFWQMLILSGALQGSDYKTVFSYYGRPSYYGMLVAVLS